MGINLLTQIYKDYQIQLWQYKNAYYCTVQSLYSANRRTTKLFTNQVDPIIRAIEIIVDLCESEMRSHSRHDIHNL